MAAPVESPELSLEHEQGAGGVETCVQAAPLNSTPEHSEVDAEKVATSNLVALLTSDDSSSQASTSDAIPARSTSSTGVDMVVPDARELAVPTSMITGTGGSASAKEAPEARKADSAAAATEVRRRDVRKQVEWYFSDANLSTDDFFYGKISSAMPDGWLSVHWLLRCSKLRKKEATAESIFEALSDSHLEAKMFCSATCSKPCSNMEHHLFVRRRQPLPPFVGKDLKAQDAAKTIRLPECVISDKYQTMGRLKDQMVVQQTLGLKEIGDESTTFREVTGDNVLGPVIATGYERVVYGDHGPYVEFTADQINWNAWPHFHNKAAFGDKRYYDEYFTAHSFPIWQQRWMASAERKSNTDGLLMLYAQVKRVDNKPWAPGAWSPARWATGYADYRDDCFYISANCDLIGIEGFHAEKNEHGLTADPAIHSIISAATAQGPGPQDVCWQFQNGHCWRGDSCKWSHADPAMGIAYYPMQTPMRADYWAALAAHWT